MIDVQQEIHNHIIDKILFDDGKRLDKDVSFQESGILDSIGYLELVMFIEEKFGIKISDRELIPKNFGTLQKVSCFVQNKLILRTTA